MNIRHHPDDATLVAYTAGAVSEGMSLVVAAHLDLCPQCRARVRDATDLGGALLTGLDPAPLGDGALAAALARIDAGSRWGARTGEAPPAPLCLRSPRDPGALAAGGVGPDPLARPGPRDQTLSLPRGGQRRRHGAAAGHCTRHRPAPPRPRRDRADPGLARVLRRRDRSLPGRDLADLDPGVQHQPVADTQTPCVCLIATDARLRFSGVLGRLFQPLVGI